MTLTSIAMMVASCDSANVDNEDADEQHDDVDHSPSSTPPFAHADTDPIGSGVASRDPIAPAEGEGEEGEGEEGEGEGEEGEGEGEEGEGEEGEGEGEGESVITPPPPPPPPEPAGFFFAVGYGGRRMISHDGVTWEHDVEDDPNGADDNNLLRDACFGDGTYMAVGGSQIGRILTTTDGIDYETYVDDDGWLGGCAFGNGIWVVVGSDRSMRSTDGGATWIDHAIHWDTGSPWQARDLAFGGGRFVAVGDEGISTSTDGATWTSPIGPSFEHVVFGDGVWIAVGDGNRARSTDGGVTWSFASAGGSDVVFDGAQFIAAGTFTVTTSIDGAPGTWTEHGGPDLDLIATDGERVVSSTWSNRRRVSTDLTTWDETASDEGNAINSIVFGM